MSGLRVGLLFGSFNPVHTGHLILAEYFATRTDLAEVWFVVSPHSPFKSVADLLPEAERLRLVGLAVADNPRLRAEAVEFSLPRPSYTVATLDALRLRHPSHDFVLLMGADNLPGLPLCRKHPGCWQILTFTCTPGPAPPCPNWRSSRAFGP